MTDAVYILFPVELHVPHVLCFLCRLKFHPLQGMKFVITGKLKESKAEVTKKISSMGGMVLAKCDKTVAAVISTKGNLILLRLTN